MTKTRTRWTSGGKPVPYEPVIENSKLAHQPVFLFESGTGNIALSCNCLARRKGKGAGRGRPRRWIACEKILPAADALAAYRGWHEERGVRV